MKRMFAALAAIPVLFPFVFAEKAFNQSSGNPFEEIAPEKAGFSSERLAEVTKYLDKIGSAAFLALYDGKAFLSWGQVEKKYWCHSMRKAFLSSLYGIYIKRGLIDLNKTIKELGLDDIPPRLTEDEKQAKVVDLIRARSGIYHPAAAESEEMAASRPQRGSHAPGTFFYYNNWDFNALGTIFEQETGAKIFEAFEREIAKPIGMRDFRASDGEYQFEKDKSIYPAYHFRMTARDLALFGLLYQRNGVWNGKEIIPRDWIELSTKAHSVMDEKSGISYGYLWYVLPDDSPFGRAFFHTGVGVHMVMVLPASKLVLVHRVDTDAPYTITSQNLYELLGLLMAARLQK
ncbi:MAG: beta-lactamase family protein [Candidatus Aminicenantes bacterium]|nr:beta-lactamase family protein [Candidatus Aminicenantes bacterium]